MKRYLITIIFCALLLCGCNESQPNAHIAATTLPVYEFACRICTGTDLSVSLLVTESVSCLHDYSLQVAQMRAIESADAIILSGAGLEEFLGDALHSAKRTIDASEGISLICGEHSLGEDHREHEHEHAHAHGNDPHIWLSPVNAMTMSENICKALTAIYPQHSATFSSNLDALLTDLNKLDHYGKSALSDLSCRETITFHDGFAYLAEEYDISILESVEEESGSEASAQELIHLISVVNTHHLPSIFTEKNGSTSAASIIAAETGVACYELDMCLSGSSYFESMYQNFDTLREALQ